MKVKSLFNINFHLTDFIYGIGYFGEQISFFIVCALVFKSPFYLLLYILLFLFNRKFINYFKSVFKQFRPSHPVKYLNNDKFGKKMYGMPSGHSQLAFFSFVYLMLVVRHGYATFWKVLLFCIGLSTIYERIVFRNHTLSQLVYGAVFGSIIAFIAVKTSNYFLDKYHTKIMNFSPILISF